jgi:hypothetical protein
MKKIEIANRVLKDFAPNTEIVRGATGWKVTWIDWKGKAVSRRWQTRSGQDFYPTWSSKWGYGGTACTALSQLIRWLQDRPVLPLKSWQYWSSPTVKLCSPEAVLLLGEAGYPDRADCVVCGKPIDGLIDWCHLDGISGACHSFARCP